MAQTSEHARPAEALATFDRLVEGFEEASGATADPATVGSVVCEVLRHPESRASIHAVMHALAAGRDIHVTVVGEDLTPAEAAERLGVSRKLVNKMLDAGEMAHYRLPQSTHKRIPAAEVIRVLRERDRVRAGVDEIMDAVAEAEY